MWDTVLIMAVAAGLGPQRMAAVVVIVSRSEPIQLLLAFFASGFATTLAVGGAILFVFRYTGIGQSTALFPWIEITAGLVGLAFAGLVASGVSTRLIQWWQSRRLRRPPSSGGRGLQNLPGFERLAVRVRAEMENESLWLAVFGGLWFGMPSLYLIAAIAAMLDAAVGLDTEVAALVVFSLVAFIQAIVPLVGFVVAPNATRTGLDRLYAWLGAHQRLVVATVATVTGVYLVVKGVSGL